ncbi:uncharacterized protein BCR38DRAFT_419774 [Pseudomassariella vexata]|uniref:Uncharacterized protein n=1 Tax=Pseudomassariella vexata TaxID=1141098 RepID=A0A1Y2EEH9_9PEZI|nr:uncharacterized protein BCR38DRAFT_419774 [Pseudomassariella vexata]ORY69676.1 hypothetical protein BCR38DRAFT_419774 [Pseudomassariella vexata]
MPVTVKPSNHGSSSWTGTEYRKTCSPEMLLNCTTDAGGRGYTNETNSRHSRPKRLVQSSFNHLQKDDFVFATKNGFVNACMDAYNLHHCLVLRPEDVWFAILTQLSVYVNAHADELRHTLVHHEGQENLKIIVDDLERLDHGKIAFEMTKLMQESIKDLQLREWILPAFTTTTKVDQTVASVIFMGTMQKYFTYSWGIRCGLPSVTLLGEKSDWVSIYQRAEKIATFGEEPQRWLKLLWPILGSFISTFRDPESTAVRDFWQRICVEHVPNGSGTTMYSGWITAFCFWDEKGACLHRPNRQNGGVMLDRSSIPAGFIKVPALLFEDGGAMKIRTEIIAGSMAISASRSEGRTEEDDRKEWYRVENKKLVGLDTIQPETGWFMYEV